MMEDIRIAQKVNDSAIAEPDFELLGSIEDLTLSGGGVTSDGHSGGARLIN
jgi:hypothetical protein